MIYLHFSEASVRSLQIEDGKCDVGGAWDGVDGDTSMRGMIFVRWKQLQQLGDTVNTAQIVKSCQRDFAKFHIAQNLNFDPMLQKGL